jgi:murein DD-endopeptidase MepM/ murein hydrolase activator NlpD
MASRRPVIVRQAVPLASEWGRRRRKRRASLLALLLLIGGGLLLAATQPGVATSVSAAVSETVAGLRSLTGASPSTDAGTASLPGGSPSAPSSTPSPSPTATPRPTPSPTPRTTPSPPPGSAPSSYRGFRLQDTVVPIAFPFRGNVDYVYSDHFLATRVDEPLPFNHVLGRRPDGSLQRGHDGVDIYVPFGSRVVSPFRGRVIDPSTRWIPWLRERYGKTIAIISDEPTSRGYAALLVHFDTVRVRPGDRVERGQVLGRIGDSGNAEGGPVHLHFELRAPFKLLIRLGGISRAIDAFDPYPSLYQADPYHR